MYLFYQSGGAFVNALPSAFGDQARGGFDKSVCVQRRVFQLALHQHAVHHSQRQPGQVFTVRTGFTRRDLLRQTRKLYDENTSLPAVHPRYGNLIHELYDKEGQEEPHSSFFIRAALGILCFVCYVCIDTNKIEVAEVGSEQIVNQIEKQKNVEALEEVWKQL